MTAADALRDVLADYSAGGLVNAIDEVAKTYGAYSLPETVRLAGLALLEALEVLGLDTATGPRAADGWAEL